MLPFLELGPARVPTYGLLLAVAVLAGVVLTARLAAAQGLPRQSAFNIASLAVLASVLGARLPAGFSPRGGGVFLAGFLCGTLVMWVGCRRAGLSFWKLADAAAPAMALGVAVVRLGCFAAGCDYGRPTGSFWGVVFHNPEAYSRTGIPLGVPLHPAQLYESALGLALLAVLVWWPWREAPEGARAWFFVIGYCVARFGLEFLRGDADRGFLGPLSTSQWLAGLTVLLFLMLSRRSITVLALAALFVHAGEVRAGSADAAPRAATELETGFRSLYNLQFEAAQKQFREYQHRSPEAPLGFVAEAAGLAFQEFHRLGLLSSKNFLGLRPQAGEAAVKPDEELGRRFRAALAKSQELAQQRLRKEPNEQEALFSLAVADGLNADYTYLVEKRGWASLKLARQSDTFAKRLLELNPGYYDAYLPIAAFDYILASLPMHQRFFLRFTGLSGDKERAFEKMRSVAEHGGLLRPFAKILLALMCLREQQQAHARQLLVELKEEFPRNSIFPMELAMLTQSAAGQGNHGP